MEKMTQRFGNKELPHSMRRQLQDVRQMMEESIEEYAERVQELATDGYADATEEIVEFMAVDAFLKSCNDKKAALSAMDKNPTRIDQALQYVKSSIHSQRILLGYKKPEVRKVQFEDEDSDGESGASVRVMNKPTYKQTWPQNMEDRMTKTEQDVNSIKGDVSKILSILSKGQQARNRSRSPSPGRSPIRDVECYTCHERGHYSNQCPKKVILSPPPKPLNRQGSGM